MWVPTASSGHVGWGCSGGAGLIGENEQTEGLSGKVNKITPPPGTGALLRGPVTPWGPQPRRRPEGRGRGGPGGAGGWRGTRSSLVTQAGGRFAETGRVGQSRRERQPRGGETEAPDPEASDPPEPRPTGRAHQRVRPGSPHGAQVRPGRAVPLHARCAQGWCPPGGGGEPPQPDSLCPSSPSPCPCPQENWSGPAGLRAARRPGRGRTDPPMNTDF